LTFHAWASRVGSLDRPDFVLFDLDPGAASFQDAIAIAKALRTTLKGEGEKLFVKTSGKTGLHVLIPWAREGDHDRARAWALGVAETVAGTMPDRATVEVRKAKRGARVYIDVLQNARGHHAVPPYVVRAVPGATISTPLDWKELTGSLDPASFRIETLFRRIAHQKRDPMAGLVRGFAREGK
jgi:bifunctional non-homologous end joining protein LigD